MNLEKLVSKYIASAEHVLSEMEIVVETHANVNANDVRKVLESAKAYLEDAKYYENKKRFEVSLASVTYCEGLLDALRLIGAVKFEWPVKKEKNEK